jgi:hypothetical protein
VQGRRLKDDWQGGARTLFGIQNHGFPNLMMVMGPMGMLGNIPRAIEYNVEWVSDLLRYARDRGHTRIEARLDSVDAWMAHVHECSLGLLSNEVDSWMTGVNTNVAGRQQRVLARYSGSALEYKRRADAFAAQGYPGLAFA